MYVLLALKHTRNVSLAVNLSLVIDIRQLGTYLKTGWGNFGEFVMQKPQYLHTVGFGQNCLGQDESL